MYTKAVQGGHTLYFMHGPPQTELDADSRQQLPQLPYRGARPEFSSVYYYWWAFLRMNQQYLSDHSTLVANGLPQLIPDGPYHPDFDGQPYEKLHYDFGDVSADDFTAWWKGHGAHCFAEPNGGAVRVDRLSAREARDYDLRFKALLAVPLSADLDLTLRAVREALRQPIAEYRQRYHNTYRGYQARYRALGKPVLGALHKILTFKTIERENNEAPLLWIYEQAGIEFRGEVGEETDFSRKSMTNSAHLLRKKGDNIIANVIHGLFPCTLNPDGEAVRKLRDARLDEDSRG